MHDHPSVEQVEAKYRSLSPLMDERMRRQWAASESRAYGWAEFSRQRSDPHVAEHHPQGIGGVGCAG